MTQYTDYGFRNADPSHMHSKFMGRLLEMAGPFRPGLRVLDVGCGNGSTAREFIRRGCEVVGVDPSEKGIAWARQSVPEARFELMEVSDDLLGKLGEPPFDVVVSTEVVEHLYAPRLWAAGCFRALKPGGRFVCTTPFHGYWKNLALSIRGHWDKHFDPLWDGGHIKLWSPATLRRLVEGAGFVDFDWRGAGRVPGLWMTMVARANRPQ